MSGNTQIAPASAPAPTLFTFTNGKPHAVRVLPDEHGEPLFHVGDLCDLLEHTNPHQAIRQHIERDDLTKREVIDRRGRRQLANFVTEPGMWSLVLGSHAPNARKVKRWVTSEVLPAIRKTGRYAVAAEPEDYARISNAQRRALSADIRFAVGGWAFEETAAGHVYNRLRVTFRLKRIEDLPAADFERAQAIVRQVGEMNMDFLGWLSDIKREYLRDYVEAGAPWTPHVQRTLKTKLRERLGPRPDWQEIQRRLERAPE